MSESLTHLQNWMIAVISHPHGISAGLASSEANAHLHVDTDQLDQVINPSLTQSSTERMSIYNHAYFARLIECLISEYPAVCHAVGKETFGSFVVEYLRKRPPASYTLAHLGNGFAEILRQTRPPRLPTLTTPDWADFLIDLAVLERVYAEVFDGPGEEEVEVLDPVSLQAIPPENWPRLRLNTSRSLRLLKFQFPVHEYVTAVRQRVDESKKIEMPLPRVTYLLVHRQNYVVRRQSMSNIQFDLLTQLQAGDQLQAALEHALGEAEFDTDFSPAQLHTWFQNWTAAGIFRALNDAVHDAV